MTAEASFEFRSRAWVRTEYNKESRIVSIHVWNQTEEVTILLPAQIASDLCVDLKESLGLNMGE